MPLSSSIPPRSLNTTRTAFLAQPLLENTWRVGTDRVTATLIDADSMNILYVSSSDEATFKTPVSLSELRSGSSSRALVNLLGIRPATRTAITNDLVSATVPNDALGQSFRLALLGIFRDGLMADTMDDDDVAHNPVH